MRRILLIYLVLSMTCGCVLFRREAAPPRIKPVEVGWASWYGEPFHGRKTASGEVYDMYQLTAAHKTLPLGTTVMVTHLKNDRSVMVTVNDRGPFVRGRIIDLSYAAAQSLGMVKEGVAKVRVEIIAGKPPSASSSEGSFTVQVGSFIDRTNALSLAETLQKTYRDVFITELEATEHTYYRVRVGKFRTRDAAYQRAVSLAHDGYTAFITTTE